MAKVITDTILDASSSITSVPQLEAKTSVRCSLAQWLNTRDGVDSDGRLVRGQILGGDRV